MPKAINVIKINSQFNGDSFITIGKSRIRVSKVEDAYFDDKTIEENSSLFTDTMDQSLWTPSTCFYIKPIRYEIDAAEFSITEPVESEKNITDEVVLVPDDEAPVFEDTDAVEQLEGEKSLDETLIETEVQYEVGNANNTGSVKSKRSGGKK